MGATEITYLVTSPEQHGDADVEFDTLKEAQSHVRAIYTEAGDPALLMQMPGSLSIYRVERELVETVPHPLRGHIPAPSFNEIHSGDAKRDSAAMRAAAARYREAAKTEPPVVARWLVEDAEDMESVAARIEHKNFW